MELGRGHDQADFGDAGAGLGEELLLAAGAEEAVELEAGGGIGDTDGEDAA